MEIMIISGISIILIFFSFITGLHYGSKIKNNELITINPVRIAREHKEEKKLEEKLDKEQEIEEINLANIDTYNGTSIGQQEFPKE